MNEAPVELVIVMDNDEKYSLAMNENRNTIEGQIAKNFKEEKPTAIVKFKGKNKTVYVKVGNVKLVEVH